MLKIKLKHLDRYIASRRAVADKYDAFFSSIPQVSAPYRAENQKHVFHQYTVQLNGLDRDAMQAFLAERDIPSMIYYPVPAHRQKMFAHFNTAGDFLPITDELTTKVISFPIHTEMTEEHQDAILKGISEFIELNK